MTIKSPFSRLVIFYKNHFYWLNDLLIYFELDQTDFLLALSFLLRKYYESAVVLEKEEST